MSCLEICIYKIDPSEKEEFFNCRQKVIEEIRDTFTGLVAPKTWSEGKDESEIVDAWEWQSREEAVHAFENFKTLRSAEQFMSFIKEMVYQSHFSQTCQN